jgi:uncharacterized protein
MNKGKNMGLFEDIESKVNEFANICKEHKVKRLYVFGSSITNRFDPGKSDYDFLVSINENNPLERGELLLSLWEKLELFFHRKIDLLTETSLKNPVLIENINKTKVMVYDGESQKVLI